MPFILRFFLSALLASTLTLALILLGYFGIALGMPTAIIPLIEWTAPLLGLAGGAVVAGTARTRRAWGFGLLLAGLAVAYWVLAWCYLQCRWAGGQWWEYGVMQLTGQHAVAWGLAFLVGLGGGALGTQVRMRRGGIVGALAGCVLVFGGFLGLGALFMPSHGLGDVTLAHGATLTQEPTTPDGTQLTLVTLDFHANPRLTVGACDADFTDDMPGNDRNTNWLGQPLPFLWPTVAIYAARHDERLLCAWNGDFFGFDECWVAWHLSPLVDHGQLRYYTYQLRFPAQDWQWGVRRRAGRLEFMLAPRFSKTRCRSEFETVLGGVRPLIINSQAQSLAPGNGNTRLRCSRTSIGWSADSSRFFVLIVKDLDGEVAGIRQLALGRRQTGGMDLPALQAYWMRLGVANAVILDGGQSTQMAYRQNAHTRFLDGGYHIARTLGYCHQRPLQLYLPMLPPAQSHGGVLNYLYVAEK